MLTPSSRRLLKLRPWGRMPQLRFQGRQPLSSAFSQHWCLLRSPTLPRGIQKSSTHQMHRWEWALLPPLRSRRLCPRCSGWAVTSEAATPDWTVCLLLCWPRQGPKHMSLKLKALLESCIQEKRRSCTLTLLSSTEDLVGSLHACNSLDTQ